MFWREWCAGEGTGKPGFFKKPGFLPQTYPLTPQPPLPQGERGSKKKALRIGGMNPTPQPPSACTGRGRKRWGFREDSPKSSTDGAQSSTDGARSSNDGARSSNDGVQSSNNGAQSSNDGAQSSNDGAQSSDDGPQSSNDGARSSTDGVQSSNDGARSSTGRDATGRSTYWCSTRRRCSTNLSVSLAVGVVITIAAPAGGRVWGRRAGGTGGPQAG
jgi:hypothetical protein